MLDLSVFIIGKCSSPDYTFPTNEDGTGVVSLHFHDYYEVFFFLSGEINYQIEGTTYHPTPGDILLIPRHGT